jgi:hypothetical protein
VIKDREVLEVLADDPELLAVADAIAALQPVPGTHQRSSRVRRKRGVFLAAIATALVAGLLLPALGVSAAQIAVMLHLKNATEPFYVFTSQFDRKTTWNETKSLHGAPAGSLVFRVTRITVDGGRWRVATGFTNRSKYAVAIEQPTSVAQTAGPPNPGTGLGFPAGQNRSSGGVRVTSLAALLATSFEPRLPSQLRAGESWSGVISGSGTLPRGRVIYVTWGRFHPIGVQLPSWQSWSYFSDHSFVLP